MQILVNGDEVQIRPGLNLAGWLAEKGVNFKIILVEYNGTITLEEEWDGIVLQDGDRLELLQFVGGG